MRVKLNKVVQTFVGVVLLGVTSVAVSQAVFGPTPSNNNSGSQGSGGGAVFGPAPASSTTGSQSSGSQGSASQGSGGGAVFGPAPASSTTGSQSSGSQSSGSQGSGKGPVFGPAPASNTTGSQNSGAGIKPPSPPGMPKIPTINLSSEEDLGCKILLCLAGANPMQYDACRPPLNEMFKRKACLSSKHGSIGKCGNPMPSCPTASMPGGDKMAGTGTEVIDYEDCPAGSTPVVANQLFIVEADYAAAVKVSQQTSRYKKYNPNSTNVGFGDNVLPFDGYPIYQGIGDAKKCVSASADVSGKWPAGSSSSLGIAGACYAKMCATGASTRKVRLSVTYQGDSGERGMYEPVKYFDVVVYPSVKAFTAKTRTVLNIKIDGKLYRQVDLNNIK